MYGSLSHNHGYKIISTKTAHQTFGSLQVVRLMRLTCKCSWHPHPDAEHMRRWLWRAMRPLARCSQGPCRLQPSAPPPACPTNSKRADSHQIAHQTKCTTVVFSLCGLLWLHEGYWSGPDYTTRLGDQSGAATRPSARHSQGPCQLQPAARPPIGCTTTCVPSRTVGGTRNARTRTRSRTKPRAPPFHRPPTPAPSTTRRCGFHRPQIPDMLPACAARTRAVLLRRHLRCTAATARPLQQRHKRDVSAQSRRRQSVGSTWASRAPANRARPCIVGLAACPRATCRARIRRPPAAQRLQLPQSRESCPDWRRYHSFLRTSQLQRPEISDNVKKENGLAPLGGTNRRGKS